MHHTMALDDATLASQARGSVALQMPLSFMKVGQNAKVIKVRGNDEIHHHLENMGFVSGTPVRIINDLAGNLIVEIKGTQVALDKSAAAKIIAG